MLATSECDLFPPCTAQGKGTAKLRGGHGSTPGFLHRTQLPILRVEHESHLCGHALFLRQGEVAEELVSVKADGEGNGEAGNLQEPGWNVWIQD